MSRPRWYEIASAKPTQIPRHFPGMRLLPAVARECYCAWETNLSPTMSPRLNVQRGGLETQLIASKPLRYCQRGRSDSFNSAVNFAICSSRELRSSSDAFNHPVSSLI